MNRYAKLYVTYLQRAIKSRLEYKKDALIGILSFLLNNLLSFFTLMFILNSIPKLYGWSMYELGFLYGFSMIPRALDHLFTDSLWYIGWWYVKNGLVDRFLIRPVNVLFQVVAEVFQPEAFGEAILGIVLIIVCGMKVNFNATFGSVTLLIVASIFGAVIISGIKLITCSIAFWTKRSGQVMMIAYTFADYARYPIKIYHPIIRFIMTFIVPFGLIVTIPVETFLKSAYNPWAMSGAIVALSVLFTAIGCLVWTRGIRVYESSGS